MPIRDGKLHAQPFLEKRLSPRERTEPEAIARLRSERILLGHLSETNITPRLIAHGEDEQGPWHRMEAIALPTLAQRLEAQVEAQRREAQRAEALEAVATPSSNANALASLGPFDASWIETAIHSSFAALAILHDATDPEGRALDLVHADLSPSNLAIADDARTVRILDLDLAWWRDGPLRNDGAFRGTIAYAAPEVARGERPTRQSDLFSLAATLLHAIKQAPPREGSSFAALIAIAAETPILNPVQRDALTQTSPAHAALAKCLEHDPKDRPSSALATIELMKR